MQFNDFSQKHLNDFEFFLLNYITEESQTELEQSMLYSLDAKSKRLRPLLLLAILDSFGIDLSLGYPAASAIEMVHTYSLIHDDLPAMDNDHLRRGKATNHIQFSEATAILAGDALLTLAFEVIVEGDLADEIKLKLVRLLANTAGYRGMVGGQQADIEGEEQNLDLKEIEAIHNRKTGQLIKMAVVSGGMIAEKEEKVLNHLREFAKELGLAYQIRDDLLDQIGSKEELGKEVMTDSALGKSTYPSLLGIEGAFETLAMRLENARMAIEAIAIEKDPFNKELLLSFIDSLTLEEYK